MNKFEIAVLFLVIGLVVGWVVGVCFFTPLSIENDMPHFIPGDTNTEERD